MTLDLYRDHLAQIPWLHGRQYAVEALPGGLTNVNLKVTLDDGAVVVVRIAQPGSSLLAVDHGIENLNSIAASQAGVGAPVIDYLPEAGLMIVGYVEGRTFTDDDLHDSAQLPRVAAACRQLHQGPSFVNDFDMFAIQAGYLAVVQERGFRLPSRYLDFQPHVDRIRAAFAVRPQPSVPCNNDLLAGNFIDDGVRLWLIDYEYSGNNDACFELGNVWSEADLSLDQLAELMTAYDGALLRHRVARARLWGLMSKYGWTLWGSIQHAVSELDFDFWGWAMEKYDRAVAEFDGPDFEQLLEEVTRAD